MDSAITTERGGGGLDCVGVPSCIWSKCTSTDRQTEGASRRSGCRPATTVGGVNAPALSLRFVPGRSCLTDRQTDGALGPSRPCSSRRCRGRGDRRCRPHLVPRAPWTRSRCPSDGRSPVTNREAQTSASTWYAMLSPTSLRSVSSVPSARRRGRRALSGPSPPTKPCHAGPCPARPCLAKTYDGRGRPARPSSAAGGGTTRPGRTRPPAAIRWRRSPSCAHDGCRS
jgi:hypothetical protein